MNLNKEFNRCIREKWKVLFFPANSSATVFYQTLSVNDEKDLMFETEGEMLANTLASALAIVSKTVEKYITAWCKSGQLIRISQGKYSKNSCPILQDERKDC